LRLECLQYVGDSANLLWYLLQLEKSLRQFIVVNELFLICVDAANEFLADCSPRCIFAPTLTLEADIGKCFHAQMSSANQDRSAFLRQEHSHMIQARYLFALMISGSNLRLSPFERNGAGCDVGSNEVGVHGRSRKRSSSGAGSPR
jgi:hypothetical protein